MSSAATTPMAITTAISSTAPNWLIKRQLQAAAGYGKFKKGKLAGSDTVEGAKTGYGLIEGSFGNGTAIGTYYNSFQDANLDDLWGAYASFLFGRDWKLLANYERVSYDKAISTARGNEDSAGVWIGRLTYGKAVMATPKTGIFGLNTSMPRTVPML